MKIQTDNQKYSFCQDAIKLKHDLELQYLKLGASLLKIREEVLYQPYWETFDLFCEDMKISNGTASKLINIYKVLVLDYQIPEKEIAEAGGWSKISTTLPMLRKSKEDAQQWLKNSKDYTQRDLEIMIREEKTGVLQEECPCIDTYTITICKQCGNRN